MIQERDLSFLSLLAALRNIVLPQLICVKKRFKMDSSESQLTKTTSSRKKTSIHVTALDGIVNVNSLFTVAIFIGFSLTDPAASSAGNPRPCNAGQEKVRRLIVYEVCLLQLFSLLVPRCSDPQADDQHLLNNLDRDDPHKADIDPRVLKTGLLGSALGSLMGSVFLMLSISDFIQVKLGVGKTVWSIVTLGVCVGLALLVYFMASVYSLCFI